jgi:hypothetical protein
MFTRKIKLLSFALILAINMIAIVNGFNSADENESKAVTEKCEKAEAEKAAKSGSCCKADAAKACADKAEKKCSKSAGSAKTSF